MSISRRNFLRFGAAVGGALVSQPYLSKEAVADAGQKKYDLNTEPKIFLSVDPIEVVRVGIIGIGLRGYELLRLVAQIPGVEIRAMCDIQAKYMNWAKLWLHNKGFGKPKIYYGDEVIYEQMLDNEELDLVIVATPWEWHTPMCIKAMETGKHVAVEVPAATTIEECWQLVETAERQSKHCVMLENANYGRMEMMVLNMIQQGILGDIVHGEGGYLHDLRRKNLRETRHSPPYWRMQHALKRNANLYPTHGLGPIANYMDINRTDSFKQLVSFSSVARGMDAFLDKKSNANHPYKNHQFLCGDYNTSLIQTTNGRTITLSFNTASPRPYSRVNMIQGTKGIFQGYPDRIYLDHVSPKAHTWEEALRYVDQYEHPLWKRWTNELKSQFFWVSKGHGPRDNLTLLRLIECLNCGTETDMNVYDAVTLSAITDLSERSVQSGGQPVQFPNFMKNLAAPLYAVQ